MPNLAPAPLFVVGVWRSGTSLLYALLNQHPQISLLYEGEAALLRPLFWNGKAKADWQERWNFWNGALERHKIDVAQLPSTADSLQTAYSSVCQHHASLRGATIWGDKSPSYYGQLNQLALEFPGAHFLIIYRDPAAILRSIAKAATKGNSFFAKRGMPIRALLGCRRLKQEADRLVAHGGTVHQIQYEEMVREPELVMRGICSFLGIEFDPQMASLEGSDRSAIYDGEHHSNVKSTKIQAADEAPQSRKEILPAPLVAKISRYIRYWQQQSAGAWPAYPPMAKTAPTPPAASLWERFCDRIYYRFLGMFDGFTAIVYCYVPLSWLRWYRHSRGRRVPEMPAPNSTPASVTSGSTSNSPSASTSSKTPL